jgi:hypothetical protein
MADYRNSCIYIINTGIDNYVGSTCDFNNRKRCHLISLTNENCSEYNIKLYRKIRENNNEWNMIKLHDFPCNNETELRIEEKRVYEIFTPTLNSHNPYQTEDEKIEQKKYHRKTEKAIETNKQWKLNNPDKMKEYKAREYQKHKERYIESGKQWRIDNAEKKKKMDKAYYEANKHKIAEKSKERIICECGANVSRACLGQHRKSNKHLSIMNS